MLSANEVVCLWLSNLFRRHCGCEMNDNEHIQLVEKRNISKKEKQETDANRSCPSSHGSQGLTARLSLCIFGAFWGSFAFGYSLGVINAPETDITDFINKTYITRHGKPISQSESHILWVITASIFSIGGCIGAFCGGWLATLCGRKGGMLVNTVIGIVASVMMYASCHIETFELLIVGRVIIGFHAGLYAAICPMYLSEISTISIRGAVGALHQLAIVTGILVSQIFGWPVILGTHATWEILLGLAIVPCILQLIILPFCPESPRYLLINKGDEKACFKALVILRDGQLVKEEIEEIRAEMKSCDQTMSMFEVLCSSSLRLPLLIGVMMQLSQQLSGMNGIVMYSTKLFKDTGLSESDAKYCTSSVGGIMVVMSIVTIPLIDRAGRRCLQLIGLAGMIFFGTLTTVFLILGESNKSYGIVAILVMLLYIVFFALGPGCIPWVIIAELFSHSSRPAAMSICVFVNWFFSFLVAFIFPYLSNLLENFVFVPFTVCVIFFFFFTLWYVPETKGKSFEEVNALWRYKEKKTYGTHDNNDDKHEDHSDKIITDEKIK